MNLKKRLQILARVCRWLGDGLAVVLMVLAIVVLFTVDQDAFQLSGICLVLSIVNFAIGRGGEYMISGFTRYLNPRN